MRKTVRRFVVTMMLMTMPMAARAATPVDEDARMSDRRVSRATTAESGSLGAAWRAWLFGAISAMWGATRGTIVPSDDAASERFSIGLDPFEGGA